MEKTILITGGTGLIGSKIIRLLLEKGYKVHCLSRSEHDAGKVKYFKWDVNRQQIDLKAFDGVSGIIHLAGAGIADERWSAERKKIILDSRVDSTKLLTDTLKKINHEVTSYIGASAIGWYGHTKAHWVDETTPVGEGFMADVVKAWENAHLAAVDLELRMTLIRIGVVLSSEGGALAEMARPVKWLAGAPLGSGKQYMSWIHIDDIARLFVHALENENMQGIYNGVAPAPATNEAITREIAHVLKKPLFLPNVPEFALKLMLGEMAAMVLTSNRTSSKKTQDVGFEFKHPDLKESLKSLLA